MHTQSKRKTYTENLKEYVNRVAVAEYKIIGTVLYGIPHAQRKFHFVKPVWNTSLKLDFQKE